MSQVPAPICAVLTPAGRGAIATIALIGETALTLVANLFQPASNRPLTSYEIGSAIFGRFEALEGKSEELVIGLPRADQVDIHCHGGKAAVTAICDALVARGAHLVEPVCYAQESEPDTLRAAALIALGEAKTARTAAILLDQYRGALHEALASIVELLEADKTDIAASAIDDLLSRTPLGLHLTTPWRIVLVGPPNAGKSSLMNALMGYERSIVFPEPGTTRDALSALTALDGWPVELIDTAGLRDTNDSLEAEGVKRARRELAAADLVIFVADVMEKWDRELFHEISTAVSRAPGQSMPLVLLAHNKSDLGSPLSDKRPEGLAISAKTGQGIEQLCQQIIQILIPPLPPPGSAVPFSMGQVPALQQVSAKLAEHDNDQALRIVQGLLDGAG